MIQSKSKEDVAEILKKKGFQSFGGSSVRTTIDKSLTFNTGILKGVPIDTENVNVIENIHALYPNASVERISSKNEKPMRMVKIKVTDVANFEQAIKHGRCLKSMGVKCHLEHIRYLHPDLRF